MGKSEKRRILASVIIMGAICILIVMLSAYAAELKAQNNKITANNEALNGEVESLNVEIKTANSIDHIEKVALGDLGMVSSNSEDCITITKKDKKKNNLAAALREEAYN
ncbi:MAG: hypothetical protein ACOYJJ_03745 [Anaerovoracaceae bacterium]|jgi:cell division protein FtsL